MDFGSSISGAFSGNLHIDLVHIDLLKIFHRVLTARPPDDRLDRCVSDISVYFVC